MNKISMKARDQMWHILHRHKKEDEWATVVFDILSIKELAIVDRKGKLPKCKPVSIYPKNAYKEAQLDMLKQGYVKEIKE